MKYQSHLLRPRGQHSQSSLIEGTWFIVDGFADADHQTRNLASAAHRMEVVSGIGGGEGAGGAREGFVVAEH